jgi:hypothetical protein
MRIIPALVTALVALGSLGAQASAAAGGAAHLVPRPPHKCVLLPKSQQPKPLRHATGMLEVTIPATTCNTPAPAGS